RLGRMPTAVAMNQCRSHLCSKQSTEPHGLHSFPTRRSSDLLTASETAEIASSCATTLLCNSVSKFNNFSRSLCNILFTGIPVHLDRKSTRLNSSHVKISYAVFCLKKNDQILTTSRE